MPGTMRQRGKDSWYLEVTIGTDFRGKPIRYAKTIHGTKKQAEKELSRFYVDCENGIINKSTNFTLNDFLAKWMDEYVRPRLKENTIIGYEQVLRNRINPTIGSKKLRSIKPLHVQEWVNDMVNNDLSIKTIKNAFSILNNCLNTAMKWQIIDTNVCKYVELPREKKQEADYYNREEVIALLNALATVKSNELVYKVGIELALLCGMRKGEIMGLNWNDIDFDRRIITIQRTRYVKKGGTYEDTPKTERSKRQVSAPMELIDDIKSLRTIQKSDKLKIGELWCDTPALLKNPFGKPLYPHSLWDWFREFQDKNNLRHIGIHGLRHTHVSMLAYLNTDKMQISQRIGHNQLSTTLNIYTHLFDDMDTVIADQLSTEFLKVK